jgi:hypothetical protein
VDAVEKIAGALLYEGYLLWPYRRSARKNQQRWTFGGVYPRAYSQACGGGDSWFVQTQCLVVGARPCLDVRVRFLQVVERRIGRRDPAGGLELVDELRVGDERYLAWQEATEREVRLPELCLVELTEPRRAAIDVPAGTTEEPLPGGAGAVVRGWEAIRGEVEAGAEALRPGLFRLTVRVANTAPWAGGDRAGVLARALVSTHTILRVADGELVSATDPPDGMRAEAAACRNVGTWPVLVGDEGERRTMLSSPIILPEYPRVAPESPGDMFDGTEIDQLLARTTMALTQEEKAEVRATDPRARALLERTEALTADDLMRLHGAVREVDFPLPAADGATTDAASEPPPPESVEIGGVAVSRGSRVRLRPRPGGDVLDMVLAGKIARVEAIEQDYDERIHVAVTLDDDPGRDLGVDRQPGHRFFFAPEEVEPL